MLNITHLHARFCDYCSTFKGNTPRTIDWYQRTLKSFLGYGEDIQVEEITKHLVEDWIFNGKTQKNWSAKSIRNHLQALSLFLDWCVSEEYINENPVKKIPRPKLSKRIPKHLSKDKAQ